MQKGILWHSCKQHASARSLCSGLSDQNPSHWHLPLLMQSVLYDNIKRLPSVQTKQMHKQLYIITLNRGSHKGTFSHGTTLTHMAGDMDVCHWFPGTGS